MSDMRMLEDQLDAALAMIHPAWGARLRIVMVVRREQRWAEDGAARIGYRVVARRARIEERYCLRLLKELVAERVLLRGAMGAGSRGTAYQINPRIELWRGVPWLDEDRERRAYRIATPHRAPDRGADNETAPRPHDAAPGQTAPRSHGAAPGAAILPLAPRHGSRRGVDAGAAIWGAAPGGASLSRLAGTASRDDDHLSREREKVQRIINAIDRRGNGVVSRSATKLRRRIEEMAEQVVDVDDLERSIALIAPNKMPPMVVDELEAIVLGTATSPVIVDQAATRTAKRAQLMGLENLKQVYGDHWPEDLEQELRDLRQAVSPSCETGDVEVSG